MNRYCSDYTIICKHRGKDGFCMKLTDNDICKIADNIIVNGRTRQIRSVLLIPSLHSLAN